MGKRKRIIKKAINHIEVVDPEEYTINACSRNARKIKTFGITFEIDFWIDKHYSHRSNHGDESGKREGIHIDEVDSLVVDAHRHLNYYSSKHQFNYINHPPKKERYNRIVLQRVYSDKPNLNIVVEYHFISLNVIEVTVVTAIAKDDYVLFDGQYAVEMHDNGSVFYFRGKKITEQLDDYSE